MLGDSENKSESNMMIESIEFSDYFQVSLSLNYFLPHQIFEQKEIVFSWISLIGTCHILAYFHKQITSYLRLGDDVI